MQNTKRTLIFVLVILLLLTNITFYSVKTASANSEVVKAAYGKLNNSIALYVGSTQALVNCIPEPVDTVVTSTTPIIHNSRTLVPVRFVSEKLGANVEWNSKKKIVSMQLNGTAIQLYVNYKGIYVNNNYVQLDVPSKIIDGRTYVPLRAISEAFGKNVFYSKRLIVINDAPVFNLNVDYHLVDEICDWFKSDIFPIYTSKKELSLQEITQKEQSIVVVVGYDKEGNAISQGSGFAVAPGIFATSLHVIQGCNSYQIIDSKGEKYTAEGAVAYSEGLDLALVKSTKLVNLAVLPLGSLSENSKGDSIVTISSPQGLTNTIAQGIISNIHTKDDISVIQISATIAPGSSGGALFNMFGEVIGVISFGIEDSDLNFAVPAEYLRPWVIENKDKNINELPVVELPTPEDDVNEDVNEDIPPDTTELTPKHDMMLSFEPYDIALHPSKPFLYVTDKGNQAVYKINYETKDIARINFSYIPESIYYANGEVYVSLLHHPHNNFRYEDDQKGTIAIINAETFSKVDQIEVSIDPYDIVVDNQGYIYVTSGSGQRTNIVSYLRGTKKVIDTAKIRHRSNINLSPTSNRIYTVNSDVSPRDMGYFTVLNGQFISFQDTPYHGDYDMKTNFEISPDGSYIFNGAGTIFYSSLGYAGDLGYEFKDIAFNLGENELFTSTENGIIEVHDYTTFDLKQKLYSGKDGLHIFYRDNELIELGLKDNRYYISVYEIPIS